MATETALPFPGIALWETSCPNEPRDSTSSSASTTSSTSTTPRDSSITATPHDPKTCNCSKHHKHCEADTRAPHFWELHFETFRLCESTSKDEIIAGYYTPSDLHAMAKQPSGSKLRAAFLGLNGTPEISDYTALAEAQFEQSVSEAEASLYRSFAVVLNEYAQYKPEDVRRLKRQIDINCSHRGNYEECTGRRYLLGFDGTMASQHALEHLMSVANPDCDHIFIATIRERPGWAYYEPSYTEREYIIARYELWRASKEIATRAAEKLRRAGFRYTVLFPEANDARRLLCTLARQFKTTELVVGKHSRSERHTVRRHFRSYRRYLGRHAPCHVEVVG